MDELFALAMPEATPGALRVAPALGQGTVGLGDILAPGRGVFADQHAHNHEHQHRLHHRPDDTADGDTGGTHHGQLAAAGQGAEADQAADQCRHRQHVVDPPGQG
ncbi:hypothetical protein D3C81_1561960 [compost metagenome]